MPTQADIDERDNILRIIRECTGQQDDATIVAYLNRRAVQSPLPSLHTWQRVTHEIQVAVMDGKVIDWSA
jgi:hypothetical protein